MSELKEYPVPCWESSVYIKSEADKVIADKDTEIAELKAENAQLMKEMKFMRSNCKWYAGDGCDRLLGEKLAIIDENVKLKRKLEDVNELIKESKELLKESQKMHQRCADNASKQIRRLKRALYKACANWAMNARMVEIEAEPWGENHESRLWASVYDKCLKKAEEYK